MRIAVMTWLVVLSCLAAHAQDPADQYIINNAREPGAIEGTLLIDVTNTVSLLEQHNIESHVRMFRVTGNQEQELNSGFFDATSNRSTNLTHATFVFLDDFIKNFKKTAKKGDSLMVRSTVKIDGTVYFKDKTVYTEKAK